MEPIDVVPPHRRLSTRAFVLVGLVVALVLAFLVAPHASSSPDGLERVAAEQGIDASVSDHALASGPLADYGVDGVADAGLSTGLAGVVGVMVTGAMGLGLFAALRHRRRRRDVAHLGTA